MKDRQRYKLIAAMSEMFADAECDYTHADIEQDLYFQSDDRVWTSNLDDVNGGDNFADYCKEFFEMLDEEEYYDN